MPDTVLVQSASANGTATPATATLPGTVATNIQFALIAVLGTNPTIGNPGGGTGTVINSAGSTLSFAIFKRQGSGSFAASSILGGTVTGWVIVLLELSLPVAGAGIQGSNVLTSSIAQLANIFPSTYQGLVAPCYLYAIARATATLTPQNSFPGPLSVWSASVQPQAGVQGLSLDTFWASGLGQGLGQYPQASGLLSGAVASVAIGTWFSSLARQPSNNDNVNGNAGLYVPVQYAGMIGG